MGEHAYQAEQTWLRAFVSEPCDVIGLAAEAQDDLAHNGVGLPAVLEVLWTGTVVSAEKLRQGAALVIEGRDCDDRILEVACWIECNAVMVIVLRVYRL